LTSRRAAWALAVLILVAPIPAARAHEVQHSIERDKAIAVKVFFADGEVLAYTEYQVFSPSDPGIPYQKGRTDRTGTLAFVPDAPGAWHVKVTDTTGHGLDLAVDVAAVGAPSTNSKTRQGQDLASWAFAIRPVLGVAIIAALFALLVLLYRRKRSAK
jgi:nickel transport protein